ncbi:MAG TPA: glycosyltransferase family 4 protein [Chitinophagaceae bacterium]|nr:glycosyltransferase family 4 protein [Chitinophagaceae bacterium]
MTYRAAIFRRNAEAVFVYPIVWLGKLLSPFFALKTKHEIFIFSPSADIGGSVKVNYDLCSCFSNKYPLVIFSKRPKNNEFLHHFQIPNVRSIDLSRYVDYKWYHVVNIFYRGVVASWINQVEKPVVIGGESLYFYKVLPHIKRSALCADVCHLNTWFDYSQRFIKELDARVFSTPAIKRDAEELYRKNHISEEYSRRLHFIDNKVDIPEYVKTKNEKLCVVYVGRGALQKRVHLIASIAKKMFEMKSNVEFSFVGDVEKVIDPDDCPYAKFYGNIKDKEKMNEIYSGSDVLLLTSAYEGLPIAVMEMMAHGRVVVSTAVDGIPDYIHDGENGFLLQNDPDENIIVEQGILVLQQLAANRQLLEEVGKNSWLYAKRHFSGETFCKSYRSLLFHGMN